MCDYCFPACGFYNEGLINAYLPDGYIVSAALFNLQDYIGVECSSSALYETIMLLTFLVYGQCLHTEKLSRSPYSGWDHALH